MYSFFEEPLTAYPNNPAILESMNKAEPQKRSRPRTPNNRTTTGFRISDALWAVLEPLLPVHVTSHRFGGGRPRVPDRRCADAIFYVLLNRLPMAGIGPDGGVCPVDGAWPFPGLGRSRCVFQPVESGRRAV